VLVCDVSKIEWCVQTVCSYMCIYKIYLMMNMCIHIHPCMHGYLHFIMCRRILIYPGMNVKYVYMHICVHLCMYIYMYVRICMYVFIVFLRVCVQNIYVYTYMYLCSYTSMYIYIHTSSNAHTLANTDTCTHTHTHTHAQTHTHTPT